MLWLSPLTRSIRCRNIADMGMGLVEVTSAVPTGRWELKVTFSDGFSGTADLSWLKDRGGVFEPLRDPAFFARVQVDDELGTVVWPNGADIAPETLRERAVTGTKAVPPERAAKPSARTPQSSSFSHALRTLVRLLSSRSRHMLR